MLRTLNMTQIGLGYLSDIQIEFQRACSRGKHHGKKKNTIMWFWYLILVLTEIAKMPDCTERTPVKEIMFGVLNPELLTVTRQPAKPLWLWS